MGFPEVLGLAVIPYSVSIRDFLNSLPINSFPWLYVISIGLGYPYSHLVSTKFSIDVALVEINIGTDGSSPAPPLFPFPKFTHLV